MHCGPPRSSVRGVLQARMLEWVAMPSSRASPWLRDWTPVSCIADTFAAIWTTREAPHLSLGQPYDRPLAIPQCPLTFLDYWWLCSRPSEHRELFLSAFFLTSVFLQRRQECLWFPPLALLSRSAGARSSEAASLLTHAPPGDCKTPSVWLEFSWIQRMGRGALNGNVFSSSCPPSILGERYYGNSVTSKIEHTSTLYTLTGFRDP